MEAYRVKFLFLHVGIFLTLFYRCHSKPETPLTNVNLSPFWQWRSAYECLQNKPDACQQKDALTLSGELHVNLSEVTEYCQPNGCRDQTTIVLECIKNVKRDFWFANKLTVGNLTDIINAGCANNQNFSTLNITVSAAVRAYGNLIVPLVSSLATMLIVTIFSM